MVHLIVKVTYSGVTPSCMHYRRIVRKFVALRYEVSLLDHRAQVKVAAETDDGDVSVIALSNSVFWVVDLLLDIHDNATTVAVGGASSDTTQRRAVVSVMKT